MTLAPPTAMTRPLPSGATHWEYELQLGTVDHSALDC